MSYKRDRSTFEGDASSAPYATYGTALPDENDTRDDGSFVPIWKQEVRDERGRKRLHGAFTGGFSAGYFNTVGSKEGWTPSTFVSSRTNRRKDDAKQRAEDYMDEEDLADAAEAQKVQTSSEFAGLGSSKGGDDTPSDPMGLFKVQGETMGTKLLRRMGWKDGQGIGARVRRSARLDMPGAKPTTTSEDTFLFAPEDVPMVRFDKKNDRKGLGFEGESKLDMTNNDKESDDEIDGGNSRRRFSLTAEKRKKPKPQRGGIGVGILNDNGSDEEDAYEIGPKIKYNRTIGGDKKKKKKQASVAASNPALVSTPVFVPKTARAGTSLRRCHDGRLPLDGFVLAKVTEDLARLVLQYAPPSVPEGWVSQKKKQSEQPSKSEYVSTADAAKASQLDPRSRAALLGEKALPGKSVFDYLSAAARDKIAAGSGNANLPQGRGEVPEEYGLTDEEKRQRHLNQVPKLDGETAVAALSRVSGGPYANDEAKKARYVRYLEWHANPARPPPTKPAHMPEQDFRRELNEFYDCARIFKPMTGFMASRFTTAKAFTPSAPPHAGTGETELLTRPEPEAPKDPAEEAAKMGMFGHMTRKVEDFYPTRLLCKRFNVKPPVNVKPDRAEEPSTAATTRAMADLWATFESRPKQAAVEIMALPESVPSVTDPTTVPTDGRQEREPPVNPERNDAVEGRAAADALKAIFGDSDSE